MGTTEQMIAELESFLEAFRRYIDEVFGQKRGTNSEVLVSSLRRREPKITQIILSVLGNKEFSLKRSFQTRYDSFSIDVLLSNALGDNTNLGDFRGAVISVIEQAIGTLHAGLWPPKTPPPILKIRDDVLKQRCADLLSAPGNYDRVIREATTVLDERMRQKPGHDVLSRLIPNSGDQIGENLVNRLFSPDKLVLSISSDKTKRVAFYKMLIGVMAYLRNPSHHRLDDETKWSWAWSVVGLIDQLLTEIDACTVEGQT